MSGDEEGVPTRIKNRIFVGSICILVLMIPSSLAPIVSSEQPAATILFTETLMDTMMSVGDFIATRITTVVHWSNYTTIVNMPTLLETVSEVDTMNICNFPITRNTTILYWSNGTRTIVLNLNFSISPELNGKGTAAFNLGPVKPSSNSVTRSEALTTDPIEEYLYDGVWYIRSPGNTTYRAKFDIPNFYWRYNTTDEYDPDLNEYVKGDTMRHHHLSARSVQEMKHNTEGFYTALIVLGIIGNAIWSFCAVVFKKALEAVLVELLSGTILSSIIGVGVVAASIVVMFAVFVAYCQIRKMQEIQFIEDNIQNWPGDGYIRVRNEKAEMFCDYSLDGTWTTRVLSGEIQYEVGGDWIYFRSATSHKNSGGDSIWVTQELK